MALLLLVLPGTGSDAQHNIEVIQLGRPDPAPPPLLPPPPSPFPTQIESYLEAPGRLLVERRSSLDRIPLSGGATLRLEPLVVFEPGHEEERMLGIRMHVESDSVSGRDAVVYLDLPEIENLIRAIDLIPTLFEMETAPPSGEIEAQHETLDGLVVSAIQRGNTVRRRVQIEREQSNAEFGIDEGGLATLREQLDASRRFLFEQ
jgi:hypothetical protein